MIRDRIRKILKENKEGFWDLETKPFSNADKSSLKFAEKILKRRNQQIKDYNVKYGNKGKSGYPSDFDEFISFLKSHFPSYVYFHTISVLLNDDYVKSLNIPELYLIKIITEYILNYNSEEHQRVDVVPYNEIYDYLRDQIFDCSDDFFSKMWDEVLVEKNTRFGEYTKDAMWDIIKDEVIEKMEASEVDEDGYSEFDGDINQEESYFMSYWHYPLHSLGWDKIQLCEFYKEYISIPELYAYFY